MRIIPTIELSPNMVLAYNIYDDDRLLLTVGQKNLTKYIGKLTALGINYVYVEDKDSEGIEIPDKINEETRFISKQALINVVKTIQEGGMPDTIALESSVINIMAEILQNPDILISLMDINNSDDYTFAHSINTTVYSLSIAQSLNFSKSKMQILGNGAILHDIGKTLIDPDILYKPDKLTSEEYEYVKTHAELGYAQLKRISSITELSRIIALEHHERLDGTGYPKGLYSDEIHEFSKIVAIADVYDALVSDRCYRKKWTSKQAADYLMKNVGTLFDLNYVSIFLQQIAIYPNGTTVKLSTGETALIKEQNKNMPLRPIVRVIRDKYDNKVDYYDVNLLEELSIIIID